MEDPTSPLLCNHVGKIEGACICIPLIAQGEKLGVLQLVSDTGTVGSYASHGSHPEQQRTLASAFAERIAMALANLRLSESLRASSIRDPLTGLFNRRYLEETLDRELHRAARGDHPVALIMCDVDHLKSLNDTLGHQAGDELLRELGSLLHRQVRGEDLACRYGGDEFLLILPEASLDVALERCEVLRKAVAEMAVPHEGRPLERLSLSLGVAGYPEHGSQPAELMAAADAALRKAKDRGRNRVVRATAL